jgi:hypothetical protein
MAPATKGGDEGLWRSYPGPVEEYAASLCPTGEISFWRGCGHAAEKPRFDVESFGVAPPCRCVTMAGSLRKALAPSEPAAETHRDGSLIPACGFGHKPPRGALFQQLTFKVHKPVVS